MHLEDRYAPKVNEIAASYALFRGSEKEGESAQDFIAEIRRLAEKCNFATSLERMLRDRIVCGVRDEDVRRNLLTQQKLTLEQAEGVLFYQHRKRLKMLPCRSWLVL
ncbi:hypothetical protein HPB48_007250 [Haemaphysalis longicornis]|uniref:Uncharacterized protein n=1 Tax=Haemaphysalis longicornis TaxID=44386 RepID=A0A9J6G0H9_HAELO|nr:hypothetical protein HPB48_007250 [Haemaphysalis longicornis]